nr:DUF1428 domain-containing protein [Pelagerythrobacter marensis]
MDQRGEGTPGYVDGVILPVHPDKKAPYVEMAQMMAGKFVSLGAVRVVEGWGDDVPDGETTDFRRAVKVQDGENVVFSFIEWPDKQTRDKAWEAIMSDPEMQMEGNMPFDGQRMFWGGFRPIVDL